MADESIFDKALEQITFHEGEVSRLKRWVNEGCSMMGKEPMFADVDDPDTSKTFGSNNGAKFTPGEFFNKPFAGAVRAILTARAAANGGSPSPASVDEIHEALALGSFNFETAGAEAQKNSIKISLGKNSVTFVKLPNSDLFGLVEWFPKKPLPQPISRRPAIRRVIYRSTSTEDT